VAKKTVPDLKELFKQAAEIASQVPESMHEAAFNRALDMLTGDASEQAEVRPSTKRRSTGTASGKQGLSSAADPHLATEVLLDSIDSTQHPGVTSGATVLDRSLMILKIAHDDHGVDGLISSDIAKILTNKFRISTSAAAVSMALGKVTNLVNRVARGKGFQYRIMAPGEEYLAHRGDGGAELPSPERSAAKKAKPGAKGKDRLHQKAPTPTAVESTTKKSKSSKKSAKGSGRPGPGAMLRELVSSGFFSKPRTISEIQAHAAQNLAHTYGLNELSTPLRRAIHDKFLVRTKNSDGQYEYASQ
jgi:hypothetical protein